MSIAGILVRTAFGKGDEKRDMGLAAPESVAAYTDLYYGQDVDQAGVMRDKPASPGVANRYQIYGTKKEKLPHVFHCNMKLEQANICNVDECRFFREYLHQ